MKISLHALGHKRAAGLTRFLLTGGTGFLGSHIAVELLKRGYPVCLLARADKARTSEKRVSDLLDWFGLPQSDRRKLRVVPGDITRPALGLDAAAYADLLQNTDEIVHCASNTSFSERKRAEVEAVNTTGLSYVLDFVRAGRAYYFHHVSTAYVAGNTTGHCPETVSAASEFHNAYEETKCLGERAVLEACRASGLRVSIYRPSIVYGDSRTGRSTLFTAVYYPVRLALFLKDIYEKDIREQGGKKALDMGVRLEKDGSLHLPLRIEVAEAGGLNLIPVDYFVDAFFALMEGAPSGGIFHIVNRKLTRIEEIVDYSSRLFRLKGIRACTAEQFDGTPKTPLEKVYDRLLEAYRPYMLDQRLFDRERSGPLLARKGLVCPEFAYEIFARCMTYAVESEWGAKLFTSGVGRAPLETSNGRKAD